MVVDIQNFMKNAPIGCVYLINFVERPHQIEVIRIDEKTGVFRSITSEELDWDEADLGTWGGFYEILGCVQEDLFNKDLDEVVNAG